MAGSNQDRETSLNSSSDETSGPNTFISEQLKSLPENSVSPLEYVPIPSFICKYDTEGNHQLLTCNLAFRTLFDLHEDAGNTVERIFPITFSNSICNRFDQTSSNKEVIRCKERVSLHNSICELDVTLSPIYKDDENIEYVSGSINNVNTVQELKHTEVDDYTQLKTAFNNLPGLVAILDTNGKHSFTNVEYAKFFNKSCNEMKLISAKDVLDKYDSNIDQYIQDALNGDDKVFEIDFIGNDGKWKKISFTVSPYVTGDSTINGVLIYAQSNTSETKNEKEVSLYRQVNPLTKLLDRKSCSAYINSLINESPNEEFGVLIIDIKEFKQINHVYGFEQGDELLEKVARRIESAIRQNDQVFHYGGNEFLCVLAKCNFDSLKISASRIQNALDQPFAIGSNKVNISASYGSANYPIDGESELEIAEAANKALHYAKDHNRSTLIQIDGSLNEKLNRQHLIYDELHTALEKDEFHIAYQPIIDLRTLVPVGMEALLRWNNKSLGNVPPNEFIPVAEETELIDDIGAWVLKQSCHDLAMLQNKFCDDKFTVAVNTSARQFKKHTLLNKVKNCIEESGIPASCLELEITERQLIHDFEGAVSELNDITDMGVKLSIDDFGNGYSSFSTLRSIPFDTLKIDRLFIQDITCRSGAFTLVKTITSMTRVLGLNAIAEGIETRAQLNLIKNFAGCKFAQGFYFSRPIPIDDFTEYLTESYLQNRDE